MLLPPQQSLKILSTAPASSLVEDQLPVQDAVGIDEVLPNIAFANFPVYPARFAPHHNC